MSFNTVNPRNILRNNVNALDGASGIGGQRDKATTTDHGAVHNLELENERLRQKLLQKETEQAQAVQAAKLAKKSKKTKPDDPMAKYEESAHTYGLMGNPWVAKEMLAHPCPAFDPDSPERFKDDDSRAKGELAEFYAAFPEELRAAISQQSALRERIAGIISAQRSTKLGDLKLNIGLIFAEHGPDITAALINHNYDHAGVEALLKGTGKAYGMRFPPIMFPANEQGNFGRIFQSDSITNIAILLTHGRNGLRGETSFPGTGTTMMKYKIKTATPGFIALSYMMAVFLVSPDKSLSPIGATTGINYEDTFYIVKEMLMRKKHLGGKHAEDLARVYAHFNQKVFGSVRTTAAAAATTLSDDIDELDRLYADVWFGNAQAPNSTNPSATTTHAQVPSSTSPSATSAHVQVSNPTSPSATTAQQQHQAQPTIGTAQQGDRVGKGVSGVEQDTREGDRHASGGGAGVATDSRKDDPENRARGRDLVDGGNTRANAANEFENNVGGKDQGQDQDRGQDQDQYQDYEDWADWQGQGVGEDVGEDADENVGKGKAKGAGKSKNAGKGKGKGAGKAAGRVKDAGKGKGAGAGKGKGAGAGKGKGAGAGKGKGAGKGAGAGKGKGKGKGAGKDTDKGKSGSKGKSKGEDEDENEDEDDGNKTLQDWMVPRNQVKKRYWDTDEEEDYDGSDADGGMTSSDEEEEDHNGPEAYGSATSSDEDEHSTSQSEREDDGPLSVRDLHITPTPPSRNGAAASTKDYLGDDTQAKRKQPAPRPRLPPDVKSAQTAYSQQQPSLPSGQQSLPHHDLPAPGTQPYYPGPPGMPPSSQPHQSHASHPPLPPWMTAYPHQYMSQEDFLRYQAYAHQSGQTAQGYMLPSEPAGPTPPYFPPPANNQAAPLARSYTGPIQDFKPDAQDVQLRHSLSGPSPSKSQRSNDALLPFVAYVDKSAPAARPTEETVTAETSSDVLDAQDNLPGPSNAVKGKSKGKGKGKGKSKDTAESEASKKGKKGPTKAATEKVLDIVPLVYPIPADYGESSLSCSVKPKDRCPRCSKDPRLYAQELVLKLLRIMRLLS
ncbi:hypothetical protein EIP86_009268 [Pleurotus ostreatoroseus]|nr:hypothetical protein EIP86_009268 [Pleurotus ostreatoroseus]